jgi:TolA-binding protein
VGVLHTIAQVAKNKEKIKELNMKQILNLKIPATLGIFASSLFFCGCVTSEREELLQANIKSLELKVGDLEKTLVQRDKNFDSVKVNTEETRRSTQAAKNEAEDLRRQMALTQGAVDELRIKINRLQEVNGKEEAGQDSLKIDSIAEQNASLERRVSKLELQVSSETKKETKEGPAAKSFVGKFKSPSELSKTLATAFTKKEYKKVIQIASSVLENEQNSLAQQEVALEYRAESYYRSADYENSALDFSEFLTKFPKSERRARALLLGGDSYVYLSQNTTAKSMYEECFKKYPSKEECKAAKERHEKL